MTMVLALALPLAWGLDRWAGEPPDRWHPVAWFGRLAGPVGRRLRAAGPRRAFAGGVLAWCGFVALAGGAAWVLQGLLLQAGGAWAALPLALLLKPSFAWRMLRDEVAGVEAALAHGPAAARLRLARLVSRDVSGFDEALIRETALETLAENLNDSLVAPLFWYALLGLPGAVVYRVANTLDAMWGYRGAWEWAGKWAARADDVLSWLPARITAALLVAPPAWRALRREARRTPSPNGGWPMGALALRLHVRLRKPGVYALNETAPSPGPRDAARAIDIASRAAWGAVALATFAVAWR
jgi:adenosylcobinamide-phosphate synthase